MIDGDLSFSCAGKFVYDAKQAGNTIQGDELEGVFARLKINDSRVSEMKKKLQNDLEILPDVDGYVMLRRKSALLKPIFCVYGYKDEDILSDCVDLKPGSNLATHFFHEDMYSGFSDSVSINKVLSEEERFAQIIFTKSMRLEMKIIKRMFDLGLVCTRGDINYTEFEKSEFFIPPLPSYDELFYKFPKYKNQYETRFCIINHTFDSFFDRYKIDIGKLQDDEYELLHKPIYVSFEFDAKKAESSLEET